MEPNTSQANQTAARRLLQQTARTEQNWTTTTHVAACLAVARVPVRTRIAGERRRIPTSVGLGWDVMAATLKARALRAAIRVQALGAGPRIPLRAHAAVLARAFVVADCVRVTVVRLVSLAVEDFAAGHGVERVAVVALAGEGVCARVAAGAVGRAGIVIAVVHITAGLAITGIPVGARAAREIGWVGEVKSRLDINTFDICEARGSFAAICVCTLGAGANKPSAACAAVLARANVVTDGVLVAVVRFRTPAVEDFVAGRGVERVA